MRADDWQRFGSGRLFDFELMLTVKKERETVPFLYGVLRTAE